MDIEFKAYLAKEKEDGSNFRFVMNRFDLDEKGLTYENELNVECCGIVYTTPIRSGMLVENEEFFELQKEKIKDDINNKLEEYLKDFTMEIAKEYSLSESDKISESFNGKTLTSIYERK